MTTTILRAKNEQEIQKTLNEWLLLNGKNVKTHAIRINKLIYDFIIVITYSTIQ